MTARWLAFGLWAAVAASAVFWGFKLFVRGAPAPAHVTVASAAAAPRGDLRRIFGSDPEPVAAEEAPAAARFQLVGVVAPRDQRAREGVALIAVDGKPPKAFRVGAVIEGDTVLQNVRARGATLGPRDGGGASVTLDIPPPMAAATGVLPPATFPAPQTAVVPGVRQPNFNNGQRPYPIPGAVAPGGMRNLRPQTPPQGMIGGQPQPDPQQNSEGAAPTE